MPAVVPPDGSASDPFDLTRFLQAQDCGETFERAMAQLRAGRKTGHWMWFVFPQLDGLGSSARARFYGVSGLVEAQAYLAHPILGPRLHAGCDVVANSPVDAAALLGEIDAVKLRSCVTLFGLAAQNVEAQGAAIFTAVLGRHFHAEPDPATLTMLAGCAPTDRP